MIKKRICSAIIALAMVASVSPSFTTGFFTNAVSSTASKTDSNYTIPQLNIQAKSIPALDSFKFVSDMKLGINLGNTFDAVSDDGKVTNEMDLESYWCGIKTTKAMIDTMKAAGFTTLRLPVSWHNHVDENYNISKQWLDRVQEVLDYAINDGMYVILNVHHDNSEKFMYPDSAHYAQSEKYMTTIWSQLSDRFKDYNNKLIFETMNEPRMVGSKYEWWIDENDASCKDALDCINKLNQASVDTIRKSGGNNADRYIMVPGYDASYSSAVSDLFKLPTDTAQNKLIVSVHGYLPYHFALESSTSATSVSTFDIDKDTGEIDTMVNALYNKFISKNVPVVLGEFASLHKNNLQDRTDLAAYFIAATKSVGITSCWWDNNAFKSGETMGLLDRSTCTWKYPTIVEALNAYKGSSDTITIPVAPVDNRTAVEGKVVTTSTGTELQFPEAIGDKVRLSATLKNGANFANGCLAFNVKYEGSDYWVAFGWEASASGDVEASLKTPSAAVNTSKLDASGNGEKVTDENVLAALAAICQSQTTASLQYWWASDSAGNGLTPPANYAEITAAAILKKAEEPTTGTTATQTSTSSETTTTTTTTTNATGSIVYGDANNDGKVDISDVVAVRRYLVNGTVYNLSDDGKKASDVQGNGDGINAQDAVAIQQLVFGTITSLPIK
jgi:aryl-phospho-beta-D-glucosidase BglC (GH1 family)